MKKITRRKFIRSTTIAATGLALMPGMIKAGCDIPDIGLQLYTVRDALKQNLSGTLKKISRIGYNYLEAAGYSNGKFYGLPPSEFRRMVEDLGMKLISSHATFSPEQQQQAIEAHSALGVPYLVYPVFPIEQDGMVPDFRRAADRLNVIGEECAAAGIRFGYHNHDFEFIPFENKRGYDVLLESTDPDKVMFQADIYWLIYAGADPQEYFSEYTGRFELWHVKDMKDAPEKGFAEVGRGIIPYAGLLRGSESSGMKHFFVEQDSCDIDPMQSISISYDNLLEILAD